ncbi:MAG TPA: DUF389 domain-containing protein, partial [Streptosporangiaceae bacterium]|nr:DUF389 domain-containing protein [Streptosporangiaceae bacterium]
MTPRPCPDARRAARPRGEPGRAHRPADRPARRRPRCPEHVSRRVRSEVRDGLLALGGGFLSAIVLCLLFGLSVRASGATPAAFLQGVRPVADLINKPNVFSVIVAVLAGIVGVVSLTEARANALIGVFISVTTIPAAASAGVAALAARSPPAGDDQPAWPSDDGLVTEHPATESHRMSEDERAELERLRAETAELRSQRAGGARRRLSWRTPVSIVLIVLGCVLGPAAVLAVWAGNEVSDTGRWVATVEPLIHDPAIQNVLTDRITAEVTSQLDLTGTINSASAQLDDKGLPRLSSLVKTFGPQITSAVTGFIHSTVHRII